ncbi:MAG TPA: shikimate dehydrogenase [Saprospiraceae bacterium]|nr:shikimate dehydrogenase [Saprospiraceae bacterium]
MKFGLIGYPLGHSFSKGFFEEKFQREGLTDFNYENFSIENIELVKPILQSDVFGLNVTIPYKTLILDYLRETDEIAFKIGAVNTLVQIQPGVWKGFNTDWSGFKESLLDWMKGHPIPGHALILGTGGAAKAIRFALHQLGIMTSSVSSQGNGDYTYEGVTDELIRTHHLIINATPLGMLPDVEKAPLIPYEALSSKHWLFDLVYNPPNTLFLARGANMGAQISNGLNMLRLQAEHAWLIWKKYGKF